MDKIYIGKVKTELKNTQSYNREKDCLLIEGERLWIKKHSWDCDWYWGFGYIGRKNLHTHAELFVKELVWHDAKDVFEKSIFTDRDFWVFKDLLKQAYALKEAAEVYRHGGHCTTKKGTTDVIKSKEMEDRLNKDLEKVLDTMWSFLEGLSNEAV